jgi:hypothetical protein
VGSSAWKFKEVLVINQPSGENSQFYEYYQREFAVYQLWLAFLSLLRIWDPAPFGPLDPGFETNKKSRSGSDIRFRDKHPGSATLLSLIWP